jgi:hypothetical protein
MWLRVCSETPRSIILKEFKIFLTCFWRRIAVEVNEASEPRLPCTNSTNGARRKKSMDLDIGGEVKHTVSNPGKITIGSATKGGEVYFTFDPAYPADGMERAENAMALLEYSKDLYYQKKPNPVVLHRGGTTVKVGEQ